jgi:cell division protein FtsZ
MVEADTKILLGKMPTKGLGAGGQNDVGRKAAEATKGFLEGIFKGADMAFITAGMGGGKDTGAAPMAGALTQELDEKANVIWVARIREDFEGKVRMMAIITGVRSVQVLGPCDGIRDYSVKADEVKAGVTRRIL